MFPNTKGKITKIFREEKGQEKKKKRASETWGNVFFFFLSFVFD